MKYHLLFLLFLQVSYLAAQPAMDELGTFKMGFTTPDSLSKDVFTEEEQSYVKGTIALPCAHIRSFKAAEVTVEDFIIKNVYLYFYDDKLFKLSCDDNDKLAKIILKKYGRGEAKASRTIGLCVSDNKKPMLLEGNIWLYDGIRLLVVRAKGYTVNCQLENRRRLDIADLRLLALASDCELRNADPYVEEFATN